MAKVSGWDRAGVTTKRLLENEAKLRSVNDHLLKKSDVRLQVGAFEVRTYETTEGAFLESDFKYPFQVFARTVPVTVFEKFKTKQARDMARDLLVMALKVYATKQQSAQQDAVAWCWRRVVMGKVVKDDVGNKVVLATFERNPWQKWQPKPKRAVAQFTPEDVTVIEKTSKELVEMMRRVAA